LAFVARLSGTSDAEVRYVPSLHLSSYSPDSRQLNRSRWGPGGVDRAAASLRRT